VDFYSYSTEKTTVNATRSQVIETRHFHWQSYNNVTWGEWNISW
jgi:hypothetical protein